MKTSLSNWEQIYHNDFAYIPSGACELKSGSAFGQREWELSAGATAIAPTLDPSGHEAAWWLRAADIGPVLARARVDHQDVPTAARAVCCGVGCSTACPPPQNSKCMGSVRFL